MNNECAMTQIIFKDGTYLTFNTKIKLVCLKKGLKFYGKHSNSGYKVHDTSKYTYEYHNAHEDLGTHMYNAKPPLCTNKLNTIACGSVTEKNTCNISYIYGNPNITSIIACGWKGGQCVTGGTQCTAPLPNPCKSICCNMVECLQRTTCMDKCCYNYLTDPDECEQCMSEEKCH